MFETNSLFEKDTSACGISAFINKDGKKVDGSIIKKSISVLHDRGNGLGAGFAAYGIYPKNKDDYALHIMYENEEKKELAESSINDSFIIENEEKIPILKKNPNFDCPLLHRYFVKPRSIEEPFHDDFVVKNVMKINTQIKGAYVFSSGKNMGIFKGVGYPEDIADFYKISDYEGYIWTSHNRFPTNTPGWWGGAHPFGLLDWSVVHNGEISSYGTNKRYLEMFGYKCTLQTDTEVIAYLFDLLARKQNLPLKKVCQILSTPFWDQIDRSPKKEELTKLRLIYGSALLNGPFAIVVANSKGILGLNDRIKLRPLVAAKAKSTVYISSELCAILEICKKPDLVWNPTPNQPVFAELEAGAE